MSANDIEQLRIQIDKVTSAVSNFTDKRECVSGLLSDAYVILISMNAKNGYVDITEVNYLMGKLLPLIEVVLKDEDLSGKAFSAAVAARMCEYYEAYLQDAELSIKISEAIKNRELH